jgi:hypothetical protein
LGLMIAVLFAASVAGVAGGLNAFSTIFTMDVYKSKIRPESSDRHLKFVSQVTIVVVTIAAIGAAILLQKSQKNVFDTLQSVIFCFAPPVASVFLLGLIWKRVTPTAVRVTLYGGVPVCLTIGVMNLRNWPCKDFWPHFMLLTFLQFVFCVALLAIVSLLTRHSPCEVPFAAAKTGAAAETAGHGAGRLGRVLWAVLALVMVAIYVGFQSLSMHRQEAEIYVSAGTTLRNGTVVPPGDDANPGTARRPFLTVDRARVETDRWSKENRIPPGGVSVWLHGGDYRTDRPLKLGDEECEFGKNHYTVHWRPFPGEKPVLRPASRQGVRLAPALVPGAHPSPLRSATSQ